MSKCFCAYIHRTCDPAVCDRATTDNSPQITLGDLGSNGCNTCKTIREGLLLPEIKPIWQSQGWPGQPDVKRLPITWAPGTNILRTVGSSNGYYWKHFAFTLAENHANDGDLHFHKEPRHIDSDTGSEDAFRRLHAWLRKCNDSHSCFQPDKPTPLPDRVLNVKDDQLVLENATGRHALYTTLSHCWGGKSPVTLTMSTLENLLTEGISFSSLPKTFRDAITVTRKLDRPIDYIWIDSLCIVQDNHEDWEQQSAQMHHVYGNSYLNIAAKHAANCDEGCFIPVKEGPPHSNYRIQDIGVLIREVPRYSHHDHAVHHVDQQARPAPLLKRGWVMQERLLTPRVVYYDRTELLWECLDHHDCQCGAMKVFVGLKDYWTAALREGALSHMRKEHHIAAWMKILAKYSSMRFTHESDRLFALEGIAQQLQATNRIGCDYIAGMWRDSLERQVTWYLTDTFKKNKPGTAPSWSWASKVGSLYFNNAGNWSMAPMNDETSAKIVSCSLWNPREDVSGVLTVRGRILEVWADVIQDSRPGHPALYRMTSKQHGGLVGEIQSDVSYVGDRNGCRRLLTLLLWGPSGDGSTNFLLLEQSSQADHDKPYYERIGLFPHFSNQYQRGQASVATSLFRERPEQSIQII